ncbi:sterile alpha motif domain-containing protein 3-like [Tachysurus ichikawai]
MEITVLRVIVTDHDIRKVTLPSKPQTLDSLIEQLGQHLDLPYTFSLQYEDTEFNNALVNLTDIADLPDKPTLKVISLVTSPTPSQADTDIISVTSQEESPLTRQDPWPEAFEIPSFSVDVEYRLRQGNLLFMRDKTYLKVPRDMKCLKSLLRLCTNLKHIPVK